MADKKAKEEVTQSPKQEAEVSNIEETNSTKAASNRAPSFDEAQGTPVNSEGKGAKDFIKEGATEELSQSEVTKTSDQEEEQPEGEHKPKLHVLAADRLNSLVNEANELGITDIVQFLNSDRTGQFYLVYRE